MIKVWEENEDWICECWGASTKHPDTRDKYSEWNDKSDIIDDKDQIFQWLLYLASKKMFPFHAKQLAEIALKEWYTWED